MIKTLFSRLFLLARPTWTERHFTSILIVSVLLFGGMSLAVGMAQSIWFDEAYSIMLAKQDVGLLLHLTAMDTHPPLYYLLLKGWAGMFGWSELALRSFSVLAASGAIAFAGLLVKRLFGVRTALVVLPFIVFAPFLLRYGFEIRMYALASLIGMAATYVLTTALQAKDRRQWALYATYAVLVALGVYTLYYTVLLWIAHLAWLIWVTYRERKSLLKAPWLLAFVGSVVLFLPWLPTFMGQISNGALAPISQAMTLENLMGIVSFGFVYQPVWQLSAMTSLLVVFVIGAIVYFVIQAFKKVSRDERKYLVLLALYILVPVALLTLVGLARPMYVERYLAHVLVGGMLLIGVSVAIVTKKAMPTVRALATLTFVILLVGVAHLAEVGNFNYQRLQKPQVDQVAAQLASCKDGATILAADPYVAIELAAYVSDCDVSFYSETAELRGGYAPLSDSPLRIGTPTIDLANSEKVFYVYYDQPALQMPVNMIETSRQSFGAMTVATFNAG